MLDLHLIEKGKAMEEQGYQGWTNHETWATALHIDNNQGLLETALDYALTCLDHHPEEEGWEAINCLSETLENWFDDIAGDFTELSLNAYNMLRDIGSLYRVNWRELADHYLDQVREGVTA